MEPRERNGLVLALSPQYRIEDDDRGLWTVPSQTRPGRYYKVFYSISSTCTCEDFRRRGPVLCKHIWAVHFTLIKLDGGEQLPELEDLPPVEKKEKSKNPYNRNWVVEHMTSRNEKGKFLILLADLCSGVEDPRPPSSEGGRPPVLLSDILFGLVYRVYCKTPATKQFMYDYEDVLDKGFVSTTLSPNCLLNYIQYEWLTPILTDLIERSAAPLAPFERGDFAADATGISATRFRSEPRCWRRFQEVEAKRKRKLTEREVKDWAKLTLMCGIKTKVVASVKATKSKKTATDDRPTNESPHLPQLVKSAAKRFRILRVMADGAFLSENNLKVIDGIGAVFYSPFKENNVGDKGGIWKKMLDFFQWRHTEFMRQLNKRNIVESVFNMIKSRFGDAVKSRKDAAIINEVLCKVLCHNLVRVIRVMYESGLEPEFSNGISETV